MKLFTIEDARRTLTMPDVIDALRVLYRELGEGRAASRRRSDTICETPSGEAYGLKSMDGVIPALEIGSVRINSDVISWPERNGTVRREKVPAAPGSRWTGLVLLFSTRTGEPLAITPDGYLQRMRVGGTSALAVDLMSRNDTATLAVFGSGWQAGSALLGACAVRDFREVRAYSPNREHLERFGAEMRVEAQREVRLMRSPEELVAGADVVLTATNSIDPVFCAGWIEPGMHLGNIRHREFEDAVYERVSRIAIHSHDAKPEHVLVGTEVRHFEPLRGWSDPAAAVDWERLPTLADIAVKRALGRRGPDEVTCFINNIGLGAQFAAVGAKLLDVAARANVGRDLPTEWFTQDVHP